MAEKVEISKRLVLINSGSSVLAKLLNVGVLVWLHQHLLRRIDAEEYSLYPVVMAVVVFLPLLTAVLTAGLSRYIVEACAKGDERRVTQIVSTMLPLLLAGSVFLLLAGGAFSWYVDAFLTIQPDRVWDARIMMGLLVLLTAIRLPMSLFGLGLYVRQKFVTANIITLLRETLRIALLFVLLFGVSTRVLWVVVATVIASLTEAVVLQVISRRLIPALRFRGSEIRWEAARELTSFGGWHFVAQLADAIRSGANPIILNQWGTPVDVNSFFLGSLPRAQVQQGSWLVSAPLQPALTAMHAKGSLQGLRSAYLRGGRYALWGTMLLVVPLIIFRESALRLYLAERYEMYADAATVMALLLATLPIAYGNIMLPKLANATAQMPGFAIRVLCIQLLSIALTLYFVGGREMGAVGSGLATFLVMAALHPVLHWPLGWRMAGVTGRQWFKETVWPGVAPSIGATVLWIGLAQAVDPDTWFTLGACAAAGCVCYVTVLLRFCMQPVDRQDLSVAVTKLRSAFRFF